MNIIDFFGRFHPLVVHLPVGILSLFIVLSLVLSHENAQKSIILMRLILLVSGISTILSVASGFLLSRSGEYGIDLLTFHQVFGIILTILNWVLFIKINALFSINRVQFRLVIGLLATLLLATGHAGGSLTHGSDFLNAPPLADWFLVNSTATKIITMDSPAEDVLSNIFHKKCVSCHGPNKQKGDLRLDSRDAILNSADAALLQTDNSLLIERITLPVDDGDHMPPLGKKQLLREEIAFLEWWISNGAEFEKNLTELNLPADLHGFLTQTNLADPYIPVDQVNPAPATALEKLRSLNVLVLPISQNSNYLMADLLNVLPENLTGVMAELATIKFQLIWLNMDFQKLSESDWEHLRQLSALRKLSLRDTNFADDQMQILLPHSQLAYLNLGGTGVTDFSALEKLTNLQKLFLFNSKAAPAVIAQLKNKLPAIVIDTGNYIVPLLASDTTEFTKADLR